MSNYFYELIHATGNKSHKHFDVMGDDVYVYEIQKRFVVLGS